MPYIKQEARKGLNTISEYSSAAPANAGELQYVFAILIKGYLGSEYRYQDLNDVMGALAGAQMEFYRKVVAPYEDKKIAENGDVY